MINIKINNKQLSLNEPSFDAYMILRGSMVKAYVQTQEAHYKGDQTFNLLFLGNLCADAQLISNFQTYLEQYGIFEGVSVTPKLYMHPGELFKHFDDILLTAAGEFLSNSIYSDNQIKPIVNALPNNNTPVQ